LSSQWNGKDLTDEFAKEQADTKSAHLARVINMINAGFFDMSVRHDFRSFLFKGKKLLTVSKEEHNFEYPVPGAPTIAIASGGSLVDTTQYKTLYTFEDSNGYETLAGTASSSVTATSSNKTINHTSIPTSTETLVDKRHIYISKDVLGNGVFGKYFFDKTVSDNTSTTASTTAEPDTNNAEPPDYNMIRKVYGNLFLEASNREVFYENIENLRSWFPEAWTDGSPQWCAYASNERFWLYKRPATAEDASFYYFQYPKRLTYLITSIPQFDIGLLEPLRAYVRWRGHDFKDRDGEIQKKNTYIETFNDYISRNYGSNKVRERVRDVMGDSDGYFD